MSTTFDLATVTHSIASLSISGVTVKDTHEIVDSLGLGVAILCPRPSSFITNFQVTKNDVTGQNLDINYTLNYLYFHAPISGGLGGIYGVYAPMLTNLALIIKAFGSIGFVTDGAGNQYHGCEITINITQFLEV
jgi:hypothetical protein